MTQLRTDDGNDGGPPSTSPGFDRSPGAAGPTNTSATLAIVVTIGVIGTLLWRIPEVRLPVVVGAIGALALAVGLRTATGQGSGMELLASLLTLPIALGLFGGVFLAAIRLIRAIFPVPDASLLSLGSLILVSYVGVVLGATVALIGITVGRRGGLSRESVRAYAEVAFITCIPPAVIGGLLAGAAIATGEGSTPTALASAVASFVTGAFVSTTPGATNLGTFLLALAIALAGVRLAVTALPIRELREEIGDPITEWRSDRRVRILTVGAGLAAAGGVVFVLVEQFVSEQFVTNVIGSTAGRGIAVVTTFTPLRWLLVLIGAVTLTSAAIAYTVQWSARSSPDMLRERLAVIAGGVVLTAVAVASAPWLYNRVVEAVASRLPATVGVEFETRTAELASSFGEATVIVLLTAFLIGLTGFLVGFVRLLLSLGYLSERAAGYSLASCGLFVGVLFGATIGFPRWLVFVGVAGTFVVWDAGRFGSTLGREIGDRAAEPSVELTHVVGTVAVGIVAVSVALGVAVWLESTVVISAETSVIALASIVVGIVALIEALRLS